MEDDFVLNFRVWFKNNPITEDDKDDAICKNIMKGNLNPMYGKHHTEKTKKLIGEKAKGRERPYGWGEKQSQRMKGKKHTEETKKKIARNGSSNHRYGKKWTDDEKRQRRLKLGMKIILNGVEYESKREAAKILGVSRPTIDNWLRNV